MVLEWSGQSAEDKPIDLWGKKKKKTSELEQLHQKTTDISHQDPDVTDIPEIWKGGEYLCKALHIHMDSFYNNHPSLFEQTNEGCMRM